MAVTIVNAPVAQKVDKQVQTKSSRCVAFDETRNVEHANTQWSAEECPQSWYTTLDYQQIKSLAHTQAKQIWTREKRITCENSYKNTILRAYDLCCEAEQDTDNSILSADDQALLRDLFGKSNSRTGLEKLCIREIAHDKKFRRGEVLRAVLTVQASTKAGSRRSRAELVRLSSEGISRASRLFARHMAVALADSLAQE